MIKRLKLPERLLAVVITVLLCGFSFSTPLILTISQSKKQVVVIDAGHGGADGGVIGEVTGVKEKAINLQIALLLGERLRGLGIHVKQTRKNDCAMTDGNFDKKRDMQKRLDVINSATLAVSIHANKFSMPSRRGAQVFFGKAHSKELADVIQTALNREFNAPDLNRDFSPLYAQKYLLEQSAVPVVIVECGFLSNQIDELNLVSHDYQSRLADTICGAIIEYLSTATQNGTINDKRCA